MKSDLEVVVENNVLTETKDCCPVWSYFKERFDWLVFAHDATFQALPHICVGEQRWRVSYCPACGANLRNVLMKASEAA